MTFLVFVVIMLGASALLLFRWGYRRGAEQSEHQLLRARFEATRAQHRLHDLTRETFVRMAEHAERHRKPGS
jgi:hypothetical protein